MKIDVHNDKKLVPLDEIFFGSVVLIAGKYYLVIDNDNYTGFLIDIFTKINSTHYNKYEY